MATVKELLEEACAGRVEKGVKTYTSPTGETVTFDSLTELTAFLRLKLEVEELERKRKRKLSVKSVAMPKIDC